MMDRGTVQSLALKSAAPDRYIAEWTRYGTPVCLLPYFLVAPGDGIRGYGRTHTIVLIHQRAACKSGRL